MKRMLKNDDKFCRVEVIRKSSKICIFDENFLQLIMLKKIKRNVEIEKLLRRKFFAKC